MTAIRTNLEIATDARHPYKQSIVEIEITKWVEQSGKFLAHITDYEIKTETTETDTYEIKNILSSRIIELPSEKIDYLSNALEFLIPNGTPESAKRELLKKHALLIYVQTDYVDNLDTKCVYNTLPENWIIWE